MYLKKKIWHGPFHKDHFLGKKILIVDFSIEKEKHEGKFENRQSWNENNKNSDHPFALNGSFGRVSQG